MRVTRRAGTETYAHQISLPTLEFLLVTCTVNDTVKKQKQRKIKPIFVGNLTMGAPEDEQHKHCSLINQTIGSVEA